MSNRFIGNGCHSRFIIGDGDFNDSVTRFLPFSDEFMEYIDDDHMYMPTEALVKKFIGDLKGDYNSFDIFLENQRDIVIENNYSNPNDLQGRTSEFKVARTAQGRKDFQKQLVAQIRYADFDGADMDENAETILSPRTKNIGISMGIHIGARNQVLLVNPDETADNGYRNGY
jgi:hypothetical protein